MYNVDTLKTDKLMSESYDMTQIKNSRVISFCIPGKAFLQYDTSYAFLICSILH